MKSSHHFSLWPQVPNTFTSHLTVPPYALHADCFNLILLRAIHKWKRWYSFCDMELWRRMNVPKSAWSNGHAMCKLKINDSEASSASIIRIHVCSDLLVRCHGHTCTAAQTLLRRRTNLLPNLPQLTQPALPLPQSLTWRSLKPVLTRH